MLSIDPDDDDDEDTKPAAAAAPAVSSTAAPAEGEAGQANGSGDATTEHAASNNQPNDDVINLTDNGSGDARPVPKVCSYIYI